MDLKKTLSILIVIFCISLFFLGFFHYRNDFISYVALFFGIAGSFSIKAKTARWIGVAVCIMLFVFPIFEQLAKPSIAVDILGQKKQESNIYELLLSISNDSRTDVLIDSIYVVNNNFLVTKSKYREYIPTDTLSFSFPTEKAKNNILSRRILLKPNEIHDLRSKAYTNTFEKVNFQITIVYRKPTNRKFFRTIIDDLTFVYKESEDTEFEFHQSPPHEKAGQEFIDILNNDAIYSILLAFRKPLPPAVD